MKSATRDEPFDYVCRRCTRCCHDSDIAINPYEVARLARSFGQTTREFSAAWTRDGEGTMLRQTETGACVFLRGNSCNVYHDRPLVCRIFPLGRELASNGTERFFQLERDPPPGGDFIDGSTVADFLAMQDALPFVNAADDYYYWLCEAREFLDETNGGEVASSSGGDEMDARGLLDMDLTITRYCITAAVAEPTDIEARRELHLKILYQQLGQKCGG